MTPFQALLKVTLHENFSLKRMLGSSGSKSKVSMFFILLAMAYAICALIGSFGFLFYKLGETLSQPPFEKIEMLLMFVFFYATAISIMFSLFRANGSLFHFKDYEIIAPLPFTPRQIVVIKILIMMINLYLSILVFTIPILFSYFFFAEVSFLGIVNLIIGYFFLPMIPVVVCSFLSVLVARVTSRFRKNNLINILVMFVLFLGIMVLSFSFSMTGDVNPFLGQVDFIESLGNGYVPVMWFADAVHHGNVLSLLLFCMVSGVPFAAFVLFLGKLILQTNSVTNVTIPAKKGKAVVYEQSGVFNALVSKEFNRFFNTPIYALNSGFGPVILTIAGIASLFFKDKVLSLLQQMASVGLATELLLLVFVAFCIAMVYTSAISLSLEGKSFWAVRSLPILPITIVKAKLWFNILLGLPTALLATSLFSISFSIPILTMLAMMAVIISVSLLTSVLGSVINLYLPKLDYVNEMEVVKQSLAALVSVFSSFGLLVADGFAYYGFSTLMPMEAAMILVGAANGLLCLGAYVWMHRATESLFTKLTA